jgi:RNA polymerase sigma-70 factor (ECF subfamily)
MDLDLVAAARDGDRDAYTHLVRTRAGRLYAIAQRILRDAGSAEDAVQEALVLAWRDLPGLRDLDRFDAWLHRLVVHACLAQARRDRRRSARLVVLPVDVPVARDDYLTVHERDELDGAFARLEPEQRALIVLRHYAGMETAEIAQVLGIPHGTVRSRLHHAHRVMRAAIEAEARATALGGTSA